MIEKREKKVQMSTFKAPESMHSYIMKHCKEKGDYSDVMVYLIKKGIEAEKANK